MNLVLLGLPGAGKGTQAQKIAEAYEWPHIATGDIFRRAIKDKTPLGKQAKKYIDTGELVPDEVTIGIVENRLKDDDCDQGFILDGFPRTLAQAEALSEIEEIDLSLYIKVDEEELIDRLSGRRVCEDCGASYHIKYNKPQKEGICDKCGGRLIQRSDDRKETVKNRIKVNKKQMQELLDYYRGKGILREVECTGGIEEVFKKLKDVIEENII